MGHFPAAGSVILPARKNFRTFGCSPPEKKRTFDEIRNFISFFGFRGSLLGTFNDLLRLLLLLRSNENLLIPEAGAGGGLVFGKDARRWCFYDPGFGKIGGNKIFPLPHILEGIGNI